MTHLGTLLAMIIVAVFPEAHAAQSPLGFETQLKAIASQVAERMLHSKKTTVATATFTDLDGRANQFCVFFTDQVGVAVSQTGQGIELLDRSHLDALLREHKLALTGLIDPKTVRRLGQIASAEALLLGTVVLLATDTARVILAGNVDVPRTKFVSDLL